MERLPPAGTGRMVVALAILALLALLVWRTMEAGRYQQFTWLLLGFFAFRVVLSWLRSRKIRGGTTKQFEKPFDA